MSGEDVVNVLRGTSHRAPIGVTWVPEAALDALFWGAADTPAEALGALVANVPLDFAFVPAEAAWADEAVAAVRSEGALPIWSVSGPLGRVEAKHGVLETLRMSAAEPARLAAALDRELHAALDEVRRASDLAVRAVLVADDLAGAEGPLVSPDYAIEALLPCYRRLADEAVASGTLPLFHSDGDIRTFLPSLARAGYVGVHAGGLALDRLDALVEAAWALRLAAIGGLPAAGLLSATREQAAGAVSLSRRGPMLIADDGGIASPEELAAFVTAARGVRTSLAQSS